MAGLETHEIIPDNFQTNLVDPVLDKLSAAGVVSDEGMGEILNLLNSDSVDFGLTDTENEVIGTIIRRLEFIRGNTSIHINTLESNFYEILDDFKPIHDRVRAYIFNGINQIDIKAFSTEDAIQVTPQITPQTQTTLVNDNGGPLVYQEDGSTNGTPGRYGPNGVTINPSGVIQAPAVVTTTPPQVVSRTTIVISESTIGEYKSSLEGLSTFIDISGLDGGTDIIDFIDTTVAMLGHGDIIQLLNTADANGDFRFQKIVQERLEIIKQVSARLENGEEVDVFSHDSSQHQNILNETQDQLDDFYKGLAQILGVPEEEALEAWNALSSYERAIIQDTGILPSTLGNVGGTSIEDFLDGKNYNEAAARFEQLHNGNATLSDIITLGKESARIDRYIGEIPDPFDATRRWLGVDKEDLVNYLSQINGNSISDTEVSSIIQTGLGELQGEFFSQANRLVAGLDSIPTNGQNPGNEPITFEWNGVTHTFDTYQDKAKYITAQIILLEALANNKESWMTFIIEGIILAMSLPGKVTSAIGDLFNLENWYLIPALLFAGMQVGLMSAMPIWGVMRLRAGAGKEQSDNLIRSYNTEKPSTDFQDWVRTQKGLGGKDLTEAEINDAVRLYNHYQVIDRLILSIKSNKQEGWKHQLEILEKFRKSPLMNLRDSGWKMMLEQRIIVTKTSGSATGFRTFMHGAGRVNIRGGLDVNIRRGMDWAGSTTFEAKILKLLGINHPSFEKLLEDDSLRMLSFDQAKTIRDTTLARINALPGDEAAREMKRVLLRNYINNLDSSKPIPERPFLYVISEIYASGDSTTDLNELKSRAIPDSFDLDSARSDFENPEKTDIDLETAKSNLLRDIDGLPDGDIKDKLRSKAEKFTDLEKLQKFEKDIFEPIKDLLNRIGKVPGERLPTAIRDRIINSIEESLGHSDTAGRLQEQTREFADLKSSLSTIEKITDEEIKNTFFDKIALCFENDDNGDLAKHISKSSSEVNNTLRRIEGLGGSAVKNLLEQLKSAVENLEANNTEFSDIREGLRKISEIQTTIDSPAEGMSSGFTDRLKTSLDSVLGSDNIDWDRVRAIRESITTENTRINAEMSRSIVPGAPVAPTTPPEPAVISPDRVDTPEVTVTLEPVVEEAPRNTIHTADGNLRQAYQNRFDRILFIYETTPPIKNAEALQTLEREMKEFAYDDGNRYLSLDEFNVGLRGIAEIPTEMRLPTMNEIRASRERKLAEAYIQRVELEFQIAGKEFDARLYPTSGITNFRQFESSLAPALETNDIATIRGLDEILLDENITREAFTDIRMQELETMIRSGERVTFREELSFTRQLMRAIKTGG